MIFNEQAQLRKEKVSPEEIDPNTKYIGLEHIGEGTLSLNGFGYASDVNSSKAVFEKGDILFGKLRPYFRKVIIAPFDGICSTDIWVVKPKNGIDRNFLFYWMASHDFVDEVTRSSEGTRMPRAKWEVASKIEIPDIDPEKHKKIGQILFTLDQKIHLNQQTNETLEAMAQAIFKSWFVDFDPVRAKIEANSTGRDPNRAAMAAISGISLEMDWDEVESALDQKLDGMSEARQQQLTRTPELFPDELVESEIGEVPKEWGVNGFDSLADMDNSSVSPSDYPEKLWKHHSFPAFDESKLPIEELGKEIKSRKYLVQKNAVLVSKLNPRFERTWAPKIDDSDSNICSTEFMQFVPKEDGGRGYIYFLVRSLPFQQGIKQRVTGSTGSRQRAKPKQVAKMKVLIPNMELRNIFSAYANNILAKIQNNIHENKELASLRDTLLPKLISGEVEV